MARPRQQKIRSAMKNYGLMWRRDGVLWGGKNSPLEGRGSGKVINFRDQVGVYVLYDEARRAVYVGQTGKGKRRLFIRLRNHTHNSLALRWQYFSWFGLLAVSPNGKLSRRDSPTKRVSGTLASMLNEIEGVLIAAMEPAFNKQGAKFKGIKRYRQVVSEPDASKEHRTSIDEVNRKLDELSKLMKKNGR